MPASASAFCCVSAAANETGAIAPIRVKGVTTTAWLNSAIAIKPSLIAASKRRGELTEITVRTPGSSASCARVRPRAIAIMSMPSSARSRPIAVV